MHVHTILLFAQANLLRKSQMEFHQIQLDCKICSKLQGVPKKWNFRDFFMAQNFFLKMTPDFLKRENASLSLIHGRQIILKNEIKQKFNNRKVDQKSQFTTF